MNLNTLKDQLQALQTHAAWISVEGGHLTVKGPEAAAYLHRMLSNEVKGLPVGQGNYQGLLDRKAMVLSLFYLIRRGPEDFLILTPPQLREKTKTLLLKMKFIEKVTIEDVSETTGHMVIAGPQASKSKEHFQSGTHFTVWNEDVFSVPVWNVFGPRAAVEALGGTLSDQLAFPKMDPPALRLLHRLSGFPEYGTDLDESHILLEAGLSYTQVRNKGCYPGQEVVERILTYGKGRTPKRLTRLSVAGEISMNKGTEIWTPENKKVGTVTSALFDPLKQRTIVLGYLEQKYVQPETALQEARWENGKLFIPLLPESSSPASDEKPSL